MKICGEKIYIRFFNLYDAEALYEFQNRNSEFFQRYSPIRGSDYYTLDYQIQDIEDGIKDAERDRRYTFGIFVMGTDELVGKITLSSIYRGPIQSAMVGYSLDEKSNGRGYMTEAARLIVSFAFKELSLHRIEAGVMPRNAASIKVLEKAGFQREGIARKNVMINGVWEDHIMFAILSEDFCEP